MVDVHVVGPDCGIALHRVYWFKVVVTIIGHAKIDMKQHDDAEVWGSTLWIIATGDLEKSGIVNAKNLSQFQDKNESALKFITTCTCFC